MPEPSTQTTPTRNKPTAEGAYTDFMSRTYVMEHEATERYAQLAEELKASGNGECALLFRQLAEIEDRHATRILIRMGWTSLPLLPPALDRHGSEILETTTSDSVHFLTQPRRALELALRREVRVPESKELRWMTLWSREWPLSAKRSFAALRQTRSSAAARSPGRDLALAA